MKSQSKSLFDTPLPPLNLYIKLDIAAIHLSSCGSIDLDDITTLGRHRFDIITFDDIKSWPSLDFILILFSLSRPLFSFYPIEINTNQPAAVAVTDIWLRCVIYDAFVISHGS